MLSFFAETVALLQLSDLVSLVPLCLGLPSLICSRLIDESKVQIGNCHEFRRSYSTFVSTNTSTNNIEVRVSAVLHRSAEKAYTPKARLSSACHIVAA